MSLRNYILGTITSAALIFGGPAACTKLDNDSLDKYNESRDAVKRPVVLVENERKYSQWLGLIAAKNTLETAVKSFGDIPHPLVQAQKGETKNTLEVITRQSEELYKQFKEERKALEENPEVQAYRQEILPLEQKRTQECNSYANTGMSSFLLGALLLVVGFRSLRYGVNTSARNLSDSKI